MSHAEISSYLALRGGGLESEVVLLEGGRLLVGLVGVLVVLALVEHGCNNVKEGRCLPVSPERIES